MPKLDRLKAAGVNAILDYSLERDLGESGPVGDAAVAMWEENVAIKLRSIATASPRKAFVAIKATALCEPLMLKVTDARARLPLGPSVSAVMCVALWCVRVACSV